MVRHLSKVNVAKALNKRLIKALTLASVKFCPSLKSNSCEVLIKWQSTATKPMEKTALIFGFLLLFWFSIFASVGVIQSKATQ